MENNIRLDKDYLSVSEGQAGAPQGRKRLLQIDKQLSYNYVQEWKLK